jgi:hypothetical protein
MKHRAIFEKMIACRAVALAIDGAKNDLERAVESFQDYRAFSTDEAIACVNRIRTFCLEIVQRTDELIRLVEPLADEIPFGDDDAPFDADAWGKVQVELKDANDSAKRLLSLVYFDLRQCHTQSTYLDKANFDHCLVNACNLFETEIQAVIVSMESDAIAAESPTSVHRRLVQLQGFAIKLDTSIDGYRKATRPAGEKYIEDTFGFPDLAPAETNSGVSVAEASRSLGRASRDFSREAEQLLPLLRPLVAKWPGEDDLQYMNEMDGWAQAAAVLTLFVDEAMRLTVAVRTSTERDYYIRVTEIIDEMRNSYSHRLEDVLRVIESDCDFVKARLAEIDAEECVDRPEEDANSPEAAATEVPAAQDDESRSRISELNARLFQMLSDGWDPKSQKEMYTTLRIGPETLESLPVFKAKYGTTEFPVGRPKKIRTTTLTPAMENGATKEPDEALAHLRSDARQNRKKGSSKEREESRN